MRSARALVLTVFVLVLAACNSPGGGTSSATSESAGASTDGESTTTPGASASTDGGGGDIDATVDALVPPNGTEQARYSASGAVIVSWTSTDSIDSLKSYYDGKLASLNLNVLSTTDIQGTHGWVFGNDDGTGTSGALTIAPGTDGGPSAVSLTIGTS